MEKWKTNKDFVSVSTRRSDNKSGLAGLGRIVYVEE